MKPDIRKLVQEAFSVYGYTEYEPIQVTLAEFAEEAIKALEWYGDNMRYPSNEGSIYTCYKDFVRSDEGERARKILAKWSDKKAKRA